jgi:hypothetical protein
VGACWIQRIERNLSLSTIVTTEMIDFYVNKFHFMRKV